MNYMRIRLEQFFRDLRLGIRNLARGRGFTAMTVGSLALGIGASTAMYSVIYAVILDPFPYKNVDALMSIKISEPDQQGYRTEYTIDQFLEIEQRNSIFDGVITSTISDVTWTGAGEPQRLRGNHCTMNTFDVMGVPPMLGRATTRTDALEGAEPVAILGYKFWQRQFGGDPGVIGRKLQLNDKIRTVIGVMPPRFMWRGADVYLPVVFHRGEVTEGVRQAHVLGRLSRGVTEARAEADLRPIIEELQRQNPNAFPKKWRVGLLSFKETFPSGIRDTLWILFGAVGLLLLIACVNVSNLLLSKAASRQKEIAVRASLGASRFRLVRQLLAESLVLGLAGGMLGVAIAYAGLRGIIAMVPPGTIPDEAQVSLNVPVLWFALAISTAAAILSGLAPALHTSGRDIVTPLKESARSAGGGARQKLLRNFLVIGEVALSLMLLVGASLMIRTLLAMQGLDFGVRPDRILTLRTPLSQQRYPETKRRVAFLQEVLRRMETVPGVAAVGVNTGLPPLYNWTMTVDVPGNPEQDTRPARLHQTNENYFKAMNISLLSGRLYSEQEVAAQSRIAVVNQAFVLRYSAGREVLGRMVRIPRLRAAPFNLPEDSFQIAGVVKDSVNRIATNEVMPEIYFPYTITGGADRFYVLAQSAPGGLTNALRAQVYAVDGNQPVMDVKTLETWLEDGVYARPRFNLLLFALFAGLGLTLALFGVYGVVSNAVVQRTQEIGIRMALGASFSQVVGMISSVGLKLVAIGIGLGLVGSLASARILAEQVWNISTFDPYSFIGVSVVLFATGAFASFWPAYRAARLDPVRALRHE